jgi:hypothetical protein
MREDEMKFERLVPLADEEMMGRSWFVWCAFQFDVGR